MSLRPIVWAVGFSCAFSIGCGSIVIPAGSGGTGSTSTSASTTPTTTGTHATTGATTSTGSVAPGKSCGGPAGDKQAECGPGEFCEYSDAAMCGATDALGQCAPIPAGCAKNLAQVCGCDEVTYGNRCMAYAAGISVIHEGPCTPTNQTCGGFAGKQCGAGEFCDYTANQMCGAGDQPGHCALRPVGCPMLITPVCGCDGKTYGNECFARAAGVAVVANAACPAV